MDQFEIEYNRLLTAKLLAQQWRTDTEKLLVFFVLHSAGTVVTVKNEYMDEVFGWFSVHSDPVLKMMIERELPKHVERWEKVCRSIFFKGMKHTAHVVRVELAAKEIYKEYLSNGGQPLPKAIWE